MREHEYDDNELTALSADDFYGPSARTPEPIDEPTEPWAREEGLVRRVVRALDGAEHEWGGWKQWRSSVSG
jgi:hypothetical protein